MEITSGERREGSGCVTPGDALSLRSQPMGTPPATRRARGATGSSPHQVCRCFPRAWGGITPCPAGHWARRLSQCGSGHGMETLHSNPGVEPPAFPNLLPWPPRHAMPTSVTEGNLKLKPGTEPSLPSEGAAGEQLLQETSPGPPEHRGEGRARSAEKYLTVNRILFYMKPLKRSPRAALSIYYILL